MVAAFRNLREDGAERAENDFIKTQNEMLGGEMAFRAASRSRSH
ncbi:hypothetical protein [Streptomyces sp. NPDC047043]